MNPGILLQNTACCTKSAKFIQYLRYWINFADFVQHDVYRCIVAADCYLCLIVTQTAVSGHLELSDRYRYWVSQPKKYRTVPNTTQYRRVLGNTQYSNTSTVRTLIISCSIQSIHTMFIPRVPRAMSASF